jgi:uncharacterized protein (DUF488 family)
MQKASHGYAEHMRSADFGAAIDAVLAEGAVRQVTVMCSESLWWRCHLFTKVRRNRNARFARISFAPSRRVSFRK